MTLSMRVALAVLAAAQFGQPQAPPMDFPLPSTGTGRTIGPAACTAEKLGTSFPASATGKPGSGVTRNAPQWVAPEGQPAYCSVDGAMAPVDAAAPPINFRVLLPAAWALRGAQIGGGGNNGVIPNLAGGIDNSGASPLRLGF